MSSQPQRVYGVHREGTRVWTHGLASVGQTELRAAVTRDDLMDGLLAYLYYVADYAQASERRIMDGQTVVYGSWNVKHVLHEDGFLDAHEVVLGDDVTYTPGVDAAVSCALEQAKVCRRFSASYHPAWLGHPTVLNPRMYEGAEFFGYRYTPKPNDTMSGWAFIVPNADPKELVRAHLHHVVSRIPSLLPYLALPAGYHVYPPSFKVQFHPEEPRP